MSCGMTSQTSKSFSSWPAVYRWRWRNEDLMWQCVADIDRHWFRRHCGQNAAACNFGFYSCIWVQLLFIVVPAVDCGGKTCELVWACLSCMMLLLHGLGMSLFVSWDSSRCSSIQGYWRPCVLFLAKPCFLPFSSLFHPFLVMSLKICRIALNCKLTMRWWANLIKVLLILAVFPAQDFCAKSERVLLILPSLLQGGRDGFSTLIFPWCRLM